MTRPILRISKTVNEIAEEADLTKRIDVHSKDELGIISNAINNMMDRFSRSLGQVAGATSQLASAAEEMSAITTQTTEGATRQQRETDNVATAMNEMTATVQDVARNATEAADAANDADAQTHMGNEVVQKSIAAIQSLATDVQKAADVIQKLELDSNNIGTVVDVITDIAEQTDGSARWSPATASPSA